MEKVIKMKKIESDDVSISKIYETIKDKGFIQELWLDVMSDIKEKPSYARLKDMVEKVMESAVDNYATKPKDHEERMQTRTIFSKLGIMSYTVDTLISEVVQKKLTDEFKSIISNIVEEVKTKKTSLEGEQKKDMLEDIGDILCNGNGIDHKSGSNKSVKRHKSKESLSSGENSDVDIMTVSDDDDSFSVDDCSIESEVSSVHTSDLSSFEDNISISSEDDNGTVTKKRVSLKLANDLLSTGEITELYDMCKKKEKRKTKPKPKVTIVEGNTSKRSHRNRKINKKYSSDDMVCPILNFLPQVDSHTFLKTTSDESESSDTSQNTKKKIKNTHKVPYDIERVNKIINSPPNLNKLNATKGSNGVNNSPSKETNPLKQYKTSEPSEPIFQKAMELKKNKGRPPKKTSEDSSTDEDQQPRSKLFSEKIRKKSNESEGIETELKKKRGRPSKSSSDVSTTDEISNCNSLHNQSAEKKKRGRPSKKTASKLASSSEDDKPSNVNKRISKDTSHAKETHSENSISEPKQKKAKADSNSTMNDIHIKHSVDSFSIFEEKLCQEAKKAAQLSSPKNNTKSYDKSDLYKPRSDFRVFNSKGSKAFTLFSN